MSDKPRDFDAARRLLLGAALTGLMAGAVGTAEARTTPDLRDETRATTKPAGTPTVSPGAGQAANPIRLAASDQAICRRYCYRGCWYRS